MQPHEAKRFVRTLKLRSDWEDIKQDIMEYLVREKFRQNERLRSWLIQTGNDELIEKSSWGDTYWGIVDGKGSNFLGKILMKIREEARQESLKKE